MSQKNSDILMQNKVFGLIALLTGGLLLVPLLAMQFTTEVNWTGSDFAVMGTLIFVLASLFVLVARKTPRHRLPVALGFALLFLWLWAELAVGVFTTWGS